MERWKTTKWVGAIVSAILFAVLLAGNTIADKIEVYITSATPVLDVTPPKIILQGKGFGSNPSVFMANEAGKEDNLSIISANDGMIEAELKTTSPGTYTVWVISEKPGNAPGRSDDVDVNIEVQVPIGAIMAWHKDLMSTVRLPVGWVECNGQVLDDLASPYHGQVIPDLNGQSLFLRGGAASGTIEGDTLAAHDHDVNLTSSTGGSHGHEAATNVAAAGNHGHGVSTSIAETGNHSHGASTGISSETHSHTIVGGKTTGCGNVPNYWSIDTHAWVECQVDGRTEAEPHSHNASTSIGAGGQHSHGASSNIAENGNHAHNASTSIAANGDHNHNVSGKTANEGDRETRPVNMSVVWIMRVK